MIISRRDLGDVEVLEGCDLVASVVWPPGGTGRECEVRDAKLTFSRVVVGGSSREDTAGRGEEEDVVTTGGNLRNARLVSLGLFERRVGENLSK